MKEREADPESFRQKINEQGRKDYRRLREEVLTGLGGCCACCGETNPHFMEVDHVANDGGSHRRYRKNQTYSIYRDIKSEHFPRDRYQLLCANCHLAKTVHDPQHQCDRSV